MSEAEAEAKKKAAEEEAGEGQGQGEDLGLTEEEAAIVIGKYAKGYVARKEVEAHKKEREEQRLKEQAEAEEKAASLIGAAAKGRLQKKKFEELKKASQEEGNKKPTIDFEIALSTKFALKKLEAMSGLQGLEKMQGDASDQVAIKKRVKAEVEGWSGSQCSDFLTSVTAMRPYSTAFSAINGKAILRMSINSLSSMGVKQFDHQRIVWAAVKELQRFCNNIEYVPADERV
ncbi:hypothetical protein HOP50_02g10320 [Chloropicon primus]|uniref:SAM domain-containing protein n=2 Tax=Chloropicon primus TaxID=1764295 RepID=A0A5B8MD74_9CHLO|nr:hypothetical protein A3770_02p10460 [Chloropicon primus]UPQ97737.1 hypothetical protein HOP50_02g10320 [Chloropicon primus]|eukprot:QDZ18528.1 hypothetical protein A3770_02p10460 [Chloropicon primus]